MEFDIPKINEDSFDESIVPKRYLNKEKTLHQVRWSVWLSEAGERLTSWV
jgi:hypothetical protein